jgi:asparagine synthase (glutamine-hydrolysing)
MCGIAIFLSTEPNLKAEFAQNAIKQLQHRGPDGDGVWMDDHIALVHTRLAILDISDAGSQPMISLNGRFVITYNGEIYNHLELRKKFLTDAKFQGHSDTETILALFEKLNTTMFQHLVGMWAIAIWDTEKQELITSRDRYGQKPLYYGSVSNSLILSSEIKPLLEAGMERKVNELAISEYLGVGNYDHLIGQTFYKDVFNLIPGTIAVFDRKGIKKSEEEYWQIIETPFKERRLFDNLAKKQFKELVEEAVTSQMLSDVQVGATLSGGLDSSIIVGLLAQQDHKLPIFTAQFEGSVNDESQYVHALNKKFDNKLDIHFTPVKELSLKVGLAKAIFEQEEPFGDPSIMAHKYLVAAAKQQGVSVLLGGQGGDELTMGYPWMYQRLTSYALGNGDFNLLRDYIKEEGMNFSLYARMILKALSPKVELSLRLKARKKAKNRLSERLQLATPESLFDKYGNFNSIYQESLRTVGLPHLCHYDDRSTMAYSIEGRMPFLDHRLMEFVSQFKPDVFYSQGYSKSIFRNTFNDILPKEIVERKDKVGFYTPLINLLEEDKLWVQSYLEKKEAKEYFKSDYLLILKQYLKSSKLTYSTAIDIFRLISVLIWKDLFIKNSEGTFESDGH